MVKLSEVFRIVEGSWHQGLDEGETRKLLAMIMTKKMRVKVDDKGILWVLSPETPDQGRPGSPGQGWTRADDLV